MTVRTFRAVDLGAALAPDAFEPLDKQGGMYVAKLTAPLAVQTPPVTLLSPLEDDDGTPCSHAHLAVPPALFAFLQDAEARVLAACVANKADWFRRPVDDQTLRAGFKRCCQADEGGGEAGVVKVKVPRDALVFQPDGTLLCRDAVGAGTSVRVILELSRVCFGRTEFGALWSLVQAQTVPPPAPPPPPPRCLIDPAADSPDPAPPEPDAEVADFL